MPYLDNGTTLDADGPLNLARVEAFLLTIEKWNNLDFSIIFNAILKNTIFYGPRQGLI